MQRVLGPSSRWLPSLQPKAQPPQWPWGQKLSPLEALTSRPCPSPGLPPCSFSDRELHASEQLGEGGSGPGLRSSSPSKLQEGLGTASTPHPHWEVRRCSVPSTRLRTQLTRTIGAAGRLFIFRWCKAHTVMGGRKARVWPGQERVTHSGSLLVFRCFDIKEPNCFCWLQPA